jgi:lipopolysaccharide/colanic/teichoic acid biosynthesis glycosyltransferase
MPSEQLHLLANGHRTHHSVRAAVRPHAKRFFDICAALALIIVVLPLAFLIIIASLASAQAPFCSHVRIGRGGREFGCLKFRTERSKTDIDLLRLLQYNPAAKAGPEIQGKPRDDPRVTRLTRFLLATNLDELPQLLNVLAGQMSLVGPRPVTRAELCEFYDASQAAAYCSVRPGLTGLWQLSGYGDDGYRSRAASDMLYVQRLSFRNDLRILWWSVDTVVRQECTWASVLPTDASGERHSR